MWSDLVLLAFGFLVLCVGICLGFLYANSRIHLYMENKVETPDKWCIDNCKIRDECFAKHEDPDDAIKELSENCSECPLCYAQMILYEERMGKR